MVESMLDPEALRPERMRPLRRAEYDQLVDAGAFANERVELLRGVLVTMSPQGNLHAWVTAELTRLFVEQLAALGLNTRFTVRPQLPYAAADDSEPEPDLAVVPREPFGAPHPDRALLVVEVADSSLRKDRDIKRGIYAEAGVPEYWIVDVAGAAVDVHTDPRDGAYRTTVRVGLGGELKPSELQGVAIAIDEILR
jgi:Uma2 family endonuclease